jgi:hypothetical protein
MKAAELEAEVARCDRELEHLRREALTSTDTQGIVQAIRDWWYEKRLIRAEIAALPIDDTGQ